MGCCRKRQVSLQTAGEKVALRYIGRAKGYLTFNCPGRPTLRPSTREAIFTVDREWAVCLLQTGFFEEVR
jgi:hypothetical protein